MMDALYKDNLNDQYLSMATGTEDFKFKFRNHNQEIIYKVEDRLYELDTQIDNYQRSLKIITDECSKFESLDEAEQNAFKFPSEKLSPLRFYWETNLRKKMAHQYLDGKLLRHREMAAFKKAINDKLD
jgi:hypothetical protein